MANLVVQGSNVVLRGTVVSMSAIVSGTSRKGTEWKNKTIVVKELDSEYPRTVAFVLMGDKTDIKFVKDEVVTVYGNAESREYGDKWFTNVTAWKVDKDPNSIAPTQPAPAPKAQAAPVQASNDDDSLPF